MTRGLNHPQHQKEGQIKTKPQSDKQVISILCDAQYDFMPNKLQKLLSENIHPDALCRYFHPIGDVKTDLLYDKVYIPLHLALPDFERRDIICVAGIDDDGISWVGTAGYFIGTFVQAFMKIPPTGQIAHIRFPEFYKFKAGAISEIQAVWAIPSLRMQAGVWPMGPSLGYEGLVPAPATQDGLSNSRSDKTQTQKNKTRKNAMNIEYKRTPTARDQARSNSRQRRRVKYWHEIINVHEREERMHTKI